MLAEVHNEQAQHSHINRQMAWKYVSSNQCSLLIVLIACAAFIKGHIFHTDEGYDKLSDKTTAQEISTCWTCFLTPINSITEQSTM